MRVVMKNRLCTDEHLLNTNLIYLVLKKSPLFEFRFYQKTRSSKISFATLEIRINHDIGFKSCTIQLLKIIGKTSCTAPQNYRFIIYPSLQIRTKLQHFCSLIIL